VRPRFFITAPTQGDLVTITGEEAHHMIAVRRLVQGDAVTLFDAAGNEYAGVLTRIERTKAGPFVAVRIQAKTPADRKPGVKLVIATAIPKGERADVLVQKCAELGCASLIPMECERSVVRFVPGREGKLDKWRRIALEASKQSGRNTIMEVAPPALFKEILVLAAQRSLALICSTTPGAKPLKNLLAEQPHPKDIICLVGPEGGFTEDEEKQAVAVGFRAASLARSVLRTETAAIAAAAVIGSQYL
jgi:16S rRNA (uracil1498-N3)-methyltransferase